LKKITVFRIKVTSRANLSEFSKRSVSEIRRDVTLFLEVVWVARSPVQRARLGKRLIYGGSCAREFEDIIWSHGESNLWE